MFGTRRNSNGLCAPRTKNIMMNESADCQAKDDVFVVALHAFRGAENRLQPV